MIERKTRLLLVGDGAVPTGFGRVLNHIGNALYADYEVHHLAVNYRGDPHVLPWKLYPAGSHGDVYGQNRLGHLITKIKPRLILTLADLHTMAGYAETFKHHRKDILTIGYFPVDGAPLSPTIAENLVPYDHLVAFNQFGVSTMSEALAEAAKRSDQVFARTFEVIPHGVETRTYFPLDEEIGKDRSQAKRELFPDTEEYRNSFIVLNGNRNQSRKRIDLTMKGFALFAKGKPNTVKLYLHMGTKDLGWDIVELAKRLRIDDRLLLTSREPTLAWESEETLNLIYNACDVGINTSNGEGWGLVSFEHAATGACQIIPYHTGCGEIWQGAAELMQPTSTSTNISLMTEDQDLSPETVAESLERVYSDSHYRENLALKAIQHVRQPCYDWVTIGEKWKAYLTKIQRIHPSAS